MEYQAFTSKTVKRFLAFAGALALINHFDSPEPRERRFLTAEPPAAGHGKPVMATFFETVEGGCCGMTQEGHENLLHAWEEAWQANGWKTKILTEKDARKHPEFEVMRDKLLKVGVSEYNQRCFWRWLAMAANEDENGGWMSDYDFFPLTLTGDLGLELAKRPGFKSWAAHVPTLIHADKQGWNQLASLMIDTVSEDFGLEKITDMFVLKLLHDYLTEDEMGVTLWRNNYSYGFPYSAKYGEDGPQIDCELANKLGAHLSHYAVGELAEEKKNYPVIEGMQKGEGVQRRAEAALIMLKDYRKKCAKDVPVSSSV
ncbi:hypothetical protein HJC23_007962 [Cyclotella cryptica]|uniref:Uncharacterized protein n=1 Tax=Cyclotella cryptica TaxID=29204 RepID=A0ABD3P5Z8_9STRA|eukprot:CCRYP_017347-RA/>CCRYP_017347-RA protein AED:0.02 eAED:0.02 QI:211/1/1/1/1/1/2/448/313